MQAAAHRRPARSGVPDVVQHGARRAACGGEDRMLLDALPIAAAIVGLTPGGVLKLVDHNPRFAEVIAATGDPALASHDFRDCLHVKIAGLMIAFLQECDGQNEAEFCDGEGIEKRFL